MMRNIKTREGFEFWDQLNALPRYAFLLSPSGNSVQKFEDKAMGNWIDVHEAQKIVDLAQERISELQDELDRQKRYVEINANSAQGKHAEGQRYRDERDALQLRLNAADQRVDELERDKARLDALDSNCWDVRFNSSPNGDAGDSSINIEVVGHWMDQPFERVIGENYSENLRSAIDQAMAAPAYPPARPEYPEPDADDDWHMNPCKQGHRDVGAAGGVAACNQCDEKIEAATTQEAFERWNATHPVVQPIRDQLLAATNMIDTLQPERIKGMIEARGSKFAIMIDEANAHYGWTFKKDPNGMWVSGRKATDAEMHAARTYARTTDQQ